ncbi:TIGR00341 family protein [Psychrobacter sp. CCUG 69069]|nr:TIGR00341 family protein [Psychrobacter sp. CCUG 69069]
MPDAQVKVESLAPDVVVATLEPSEAESPSTAEDSPAIGEKSRTKSESDFFQSDSADSTAKPSQDSGEVSVEAEAAHPATAQETSIQKTSIEKMDGQSADTSTCSHVPTTKTLASTHQQKTEDGTKDDHKNGNPDNQKHQDSDDIESTNKHSEQESDEEEEVKEEKEAKLESYKQFVAEQFSNQKVDYPEVRVKIEASALPSRMYFIMNTLSAIIASYGLVTNSAAVVIGAMLVAMMLGPITGVALAIIDHRMPLLRKSLITVVVGVSLVVLVGFVVGWLHKDQPLTAEILSRTQPTSMDLMIALAGGTAGAYAMVSPHLSVAVVGVAVATALVPPLAASGVLFANGEMQLGFGALLLAATNIIAIQFTNALVLWVLGFRRLVDDDYKSNTYLTFLQRNAVTLLLLGGLGAYLTINLQTNAKQQVFESSVKEAINSYFIDKGNVLTNTQFDTSENNKVVRAVIRGETLPSSYDVRQIETIITQDMVENFPEYLPIKLQLRYLPVQVIESNPLVQDKLDKTDAAILTN